MKKLLIMLAAFWLINILGCSKTQEKIEPINSDILLIGGGIMGATLGSMIRELDPDTNIILLERLDQVAQESTAVWNNAGTGHSAFCELNYTPEQPDGSINIAKALIISQQFEKTRQFWAYAVQNNLLPEPKSFIRSVPHISFVFGAENSKFLRKRYETLKIYPLFDNMIFTQDHEEIRRWVPLIMEGRDPEQKVAATKMTRGTDVNFGQVTKSLVESLGKKPNTKILLSHEVIDFKQEPDQSWLVFVKDKKNKINKVFRSKFVFIGAGGAALPLLQKTKITEGRDFAGFPVGGEWLITDNPDLVSRHMGKVYGKAAVDAPPMSTPHLDTRHIDGKKYLLFGPFAVFSTKFLKNGSWVDILSSFKLYNAWPMLQAGFTNISLTIYLLKQVLMGKKRKMEMLRTYFPNAQDSDWREQRAGQRVQIIKNLPTKGGTLKFGTEIVSSQDNNLVALLGASPGASIAVQIALDILENSFAQKLEQPGWQRKIRAMIPGYNINMENNRQLMNSILDYSSRVLQLDSQKKQDQN